MEHTEYLREIARKGGQVGGRSRSKKKLEATRRNIEKARAILAEMRAKEKDKKN